MGVDEVSKAVLITGCSSGIGKATAEHMARTGWTVYATARKPESLTDLEAAGARPLQLDVCEEDSLQTAVKTVEAEEGAVGVLVNNAGYGQEGAAEDVSIDQWRDQFETNVFGVARLTQLVLPGMRKQGWGRVINVSSMGGKLTFPGGGVYHASKHALEAYSDALRFELRGFGVSVIVIEPGLVRTRFGETSIAAIDTISSSDGPYEEFNKSVAQVIHGAYEGPMSRIATSPEAVAKVIAKAAGARRPRTRYVVPAMINALLAVRRILPDRAFDLMLRTQFPTPRMPKG